MRYSYKQIITPEHLLETWKLFLRGKRHKKDVAQFEANLAGELAALHRDLARKTYVHGPYAAFHVADPKPRDIHKASVRDRFVHHLIYKALYPYFDKRFIHDSYSCRKEKGTHRALDRFRYFAGKVSQNNTCTCYVLKCDVRKFFANIRHDVLFKILEWHIPGKDMLYLIRQVVSSFHANQQGVGLPLGNLTSQLLVNVYMHEFDRYVKHNLNIKYYIRYADDFAVLSEDKRYLEETLSQISSFLQKRLHLTLHDDKVSIQTYTSGVDFLGWVHFPGYRKLRTSTKRRILRKMKYYPRRESVNSYRGFLRHGDTYKIRKEAGFTSPYL